MNSSYSAINETTANRPHLQPLISQLKNQRNFLQEILDAIERRDMSMPEIKHLLGIAERNMKSIKRVTRQAFSTNK